MIKINKEELRDKIHACWIGKNIGGTLGEPFEAVRSTVECDGFTTESGKPMPNDDLDLQLIWLMAMYEAGPQAVDANLLGEFWNEYVTPYWAEYGNAKANMRMGLRPPVSGQYENNMKHSNGAWIRTEVWATLYPGDIEKAVHYAIEDASVDHGVGEGTYAAVFVAAMESAAFFVKDLRTLINIGLSNIPAECKISKYIKETVICFDSGMTWLEARNKITDMTLADEELGWMQAPANLSYAIIGLLWGAGDFKETLLIACRCGDDTDCTCATAGALLGIMHGTAIIPDDWRAHIGDEIVTISLNCGALRTYSRIDKTHYLLPKSCTELTDVIMDMHPITLHTRPVKVTDGEGCFDENMLAGFYGEKENLDKMPEYMLKFSSVIASYRVEFSGEPRIKPTEELKLTLVARNKFLSQKVLSFKWHIPEGWKVSGNRTMNVDAMHCGEFRNEFTVTAGENVEAKTTLVLEINCEGHHDSICIPIVLLG